MSLLQAPSAKTLPGALLCLFRAIMHSMGAHILCYHPTRYLTNSGNQPSHTNSPPCKPSPGNETVVVVIVTHLNFNHCLYINSAMSLLEAPGAKTLNWIFCFVPIYGPFTGHYYNRIS